MFGPSASSVVIECSASNTCMAIHSIVTSLILFIVLLTGFAYTTVLERRFLAFIQDRIGPNRAGPLGLLQPVADGIKLIFKEDVTPVSAEKVVFCNSGSEATFSAIRLSRAVTGKKKLIKFQGCYHGWHDPVVMNVISPPEFIGRKHLLSAGLGPDVENTIVLEYNNIDELRATFAAEGDDIAAVIIEPIAHNIGIVIATNEFLAEIRSLCDQHGSLFIMDEVITGFRHALGGYQSICGVKPDLTTMGKAMANGYPISALAGPAAYMDRLATRAGGDTFFAGTFNAHVYSTTASLATIDLLEDGAVHDRIYRFGERLAKGLQDILDRLGVTATVRNFGSVVVPYYLNGPINSFTDLLRNDNEFDVAFRRAMVDRGFFMIPIAMKAVSFSIPSRNKAAMPSMIDMIQ